MEEHFVSRDLDDRGWLERLKARGFLLCRGVARTFSPSRCIETPLTVVPEVAGDWSESADSLIIGCHGLGGFGEAWLAFIEDMRVRRPHASILLRTTGDSGVDRCAYIADVSMLVAGWRGTHRAKPIWIVGFSAGASLALSLGKSIGGDNINVVCAAGLLWGTRWFSLSRLSPFASGDDELSAGSELLRMQLSSARQAQHDYTPRYFFFASPDDMWVVPWNGALPHLGARDEHVILPGLGHEDVLRHVLRVLSDGSAAEIFLQ